MSKSTNASGGIGLSGFIFLIFLFLKLAEIGVVAHWSWWWVTSPLWIHAAIILTIFAVIFVLWLIVKIIEIPFK